MAIIKLDGYKKVEGSTGLNDYTSRVNSALFDYFDLDASFEYSKTRGDESSAELHEVDEETIALVTLEDGAQLYLSLDELEQLDDFEVDQSRGVKEFFKKAIDFLKPKAWVTDIAAEKLLDKVEEKLERKLQRSEGIYQVGWVSGPLPDNSEAIPLFEGADTGLNSEENVHFALSKNTPKGNKFTKTKPNLVFIHGTFSSTNGSFDGFGREENKNIINEFRNEYGDHIFSFQHRSISNSPVQNAINLLENIPKNIELHLISHSRGGLIGELIACGSYDAQDGDPINLEHAKLFYDAYAENREDKEGADRELRELQRLNKLLKDKNPKVTSFVRCACPVKGTSLLKNNSNKVNKGAKAISAVMIELLKKASLASPVLNALITLPIEVLALSINKVRNISSMPGLAAMSPESPFIQLINSDLRQLESQLVVISGDAKGGLSEGLGYNLFNILTFLYFKQKNDFVVDTRFMFGGALRKENNAWYALEKSSGVNHFSYFKRPDSAQRVANALHFSPGEMKSTEFNIITSSIRSGQDSSVRSGGDTSGPVVYLLPGIMGSYLSIDNEMIWVNYWNLFKGDIKKIRSKNKNVNPSGIHTDSYSDFVDFLKLNNEVVSFPYDWRLSVRQEAKRLAVAIETKLDELQQEVINTDKDPRPIRLVGHSMGGLVIRSLAIVAPELWKKLIAQKEFRFLMLGTPNQGAHAILRSLSGHNKMVRRLAMIDFEHNKKEITSIVAEFEGATDLIPVSDGGKWFDHSNWSDVKNTATKEKALSLPAKALLDKSKDFYAELENHPLNAHELTNKVIYVAGHAERTAYDLEVTSKGKIEFKATSRGDGSVTWESGIPEGITAWYVDAEHGSMADEKQYFEAYADLLSNGTTTRIGQQEPSTRAVIDVPNMREEDEPIDVPTAQDIDTILSEKTFTDELQPIDPENKIAVSVQHCNLKFIHGDIAVGHYLGDSLVGAEKAVNYCLDGLLEQSRDLGTYPGDLSTSKYFYAANNANTIHGGLIIGLGGVGSLTAGSLKTTYSRAILQYLEAKQLSDSNPAKKLSTLLIGSSVGGVSIRASVIAMLEGIRNANRQMKSVSLHSRRASPYISELKIVELHEDAAVEALHALHAVVNSNPDMEKSISVSAKLRQHDGGLSRIYKQTDDDWWRRLDVSLINQGRNLEFKLVGDSSGAYQIRRHFNADLIDTFIKKAITTPYWSKDIAVTLFELLLPRQLKEFAFEQHKLLLVVDEKTAQYPWELIEDRLHSETEPLGVRVGLVRQLADVKNRNGSKYFLNKDEIIIIGNPLLDPKSNLKSLKGAEQEARQVQRVFDESGYRVHAAIAKPYDYTIETLFSNDCKVLHLAGHGVHRENQATGKFESGLVLDSGQFISADLIEHTRYIPELVFINCCHLGDLTTLETQVSGSNLNIMAASISRKFIEMGAKAVVAAGWAVDDNAASDFATTFYHKMLVDGASFGEAVIEARRAAYKRSPFSNTWGAYQCYGDSSFKLASNKSHRKRAKLRVVSINEAITMVKNVIAEAKSDSATPERIFEAKLKRIDKAVNEIGGTNDPKYLETSGLGYGEIERFEVAIKRIQSAVDIDVSQISYRATDELANFKARYAAKLTTTQYATKAEKDDATRFARSLIKESLDYLKLELKKGREHNKLYEYLGSSYKRKCLVTSAGRKANLTEMASNYQCAYTTQQENSNHQGQIATYPAIQWLVAKLVIFWRYQLKGQQPDGFNEIKDVIAQIENTIKRTLEENEPADFWSLNDNSDLNVVKLLLPKARLTQDNGDLDYYRSVGSKRQYASVLDNLKFIEAMLDYKKGRKGIEKVQLAISKVRENLEEKLSTEN